MTRGLCVGFLPRIALFVVVSAVVTGCGSKAVVSSNQAITSATTQASASSTATPTPVPSPRPATSDELSAMISAGKGPAEKDLKLGDGASCPGNQECLFVDKATGTVGVNAGFFHASEGCPNGCGGAGCWIYLYSEAGNWHYVNARCAQSPGYVPGQGSIVYVSGCANVRANPGSNGQVSDCLKNGTQVNVDSAPLYSDGKIWWHLQGKGWIAHDFLVAPKNVA